MHEHHVFAELSKTVPPALVAAASFGGVSLNDWVLLLTIFYLVLQIVWLLWRWLKYPGGKE